MTQGVRATGLVEHGSNQDFAGGLAWLAARISLLSDSPAIEPSVAAGLPLVPAGRELRTAEGLPLSRGGDRVRRPAPSVIGTIACRGTGASADSSAHCRSHGSSTNARGPARLAPSRRLLLGTDDPGCNGCGHEVKCQTNGTDRGQHPEPCDRAVLVRPNPEREAKEGGDPYDKRH